MTTKSRRGLQNLIPDYSFTVKTLKSLKSHFLASPPYCPRAPRSSQNPPELPQARRRSLSSQIPQESPGVPRSPQDSPGVPRSPQESPGVPRILQEFPRVPRTPQDSPGVPRSPQEPPGVPRSPQDTPGVSRIPQDSPGFTRSPQESTRRTTPGKLRGTRHTPQHVQPTRAHHARHVARMLFRLSACMPYICRMQRDYTTSIAHFLYSRPNLKPMPWLNLRIREGWNLGRRGVHPTHNTRQATRHTTHTTACATHAHTPCTPRCTHVVRPFCLHATYLPHATRLHNLDCAFPVLPTKSETDALAQFTHKRRMEFRAQPKP